MDIGYGFHDVGAALPADAENDRSAVVMETGAVAVLHRVGDLGDITQTHGGAVLVAHDQVAISQCGAQRLAGLHLPAVASLLDHAHRPQRITAGNDTAHLVQRDAIVHQRSRIQLHPHSRQGRAAYTHLANTRNLRDLLRQNSRAYVVQLAGRQVGRTQRQPHDRCLRRVDLVVFGVARHARRQVATHRVDRRLHLARRFIEVAVQLKGERHLGRALVGR